MKENWFELAIIAFIAIGIAIAIWKGGQRNPESTGQLGNRLGKIDTDFKAMRTELKTIERRVGDIERGAAKGSDIERLERLVADQSRQIEHQSMQIAELSETSAGIRADGEQRGKQLDRLYDFIVQRGMSK